MMDYEALRRWAEEGRLAGTRLPPQLVKYWVAGAGAAKIGWGVPGDFKRCITNIQAEVTDHGGKPLAGHVIDGLCATLHKLATGASPGNAPGEGGKHGRSMQGAGMAKYNADQMKAMGAKGHAFKNPDGSYSYPIGDAEDLMNAMHAVGRGGASHDAIRKYIMARAKAMGMSSKIPDNWNSDGSIRSATVDMVERRFTTVTVEARVMGDGHAARIGGYAAKFNTYSRNLGGFVEQVNPAFFNKSRGDGWPDVVARFNHDDSMLLGTTAGRTLSLAVDNVGLNYDVEPPPSMRHVVELVQRGDVQKSSFAFRTLEDDWTTTEDGGPLRTLVTGVLVDVAPVVTPAYTDTSAGLRSLASKFDADLEEVRSLAEVGELRKFFVRTDQGAGVAPKPRMFGHAAAAALLARREDPYT